VTETLTGLSVDKSHLTAAITTQSKAVSSLRRRSGGSPAEDRSTPPGAANATSTRARVATKSGVIDTGIAAFGPVALSNIEVSPVLAASMSRAMPLATAASSQQGVSRGNTLPVSEPTSVSGLRTKGLVAPASVGVTERASNAFSMSEMGDGPHAIAHAGEAVTSSWAGRDPDQKLPLLPLLVDAPQPGGRGGAAASLVDDDGDGKPDQEPAMADLDDILDMLDR
jgi:hypothetical protein